MSEAASHKNRATLRFYEELNDHLPEKIRKKELSYDFDDPATVGTAIQALGIPLEAVDLVLVNGASVDFGHILRGGDRVSVYPIFERFDITGVTRVREKPLIKTRRPKNQA